MSIMSCQKVSFRYENQVVLSDLSFNVNQGDYLCILGENGAGKSTLIHGLLGLKKPSAGEILLGGGLKKKQIGYLPQQTGVQKDFPASVFEVVLSGCLNQMGLRPFYTQKEKQRAEENLKRLGAYELRKICYKELSGGQQQRVLLARALCATEKLLLLDEPAAGLDPLVTSEFYSLVRQLNCKEEITVIMVSHDIHGSLEHASHILHLYKGGYFYGTKQEYLASEYGNLFIQGEKL